MGFAKGSELARRVLAQYDAMEFSADGEFLHSHIAPAMFMRGCGRRVQEIASPAEFIDDDAVLNVLPPEYFSPKEWKSGRVVLTKNTYSIHQFNGNWLNLGGKLQKWLGNHGHPLHRVMARIRQSFKNKLR